MYQMYKRIILLVLLCAVVCLCSCSSKKRAYDGRITYEEYLKRNYEMQPESSKELIKDNKKRSKKDTPLRQKKKSCTGCRKTKSKSAINDAVINDGVRDIK